MLRSKMMQISEIDPNTGVEEYKKKPRISLIYKAFCFLSRLLSGPSGAENGTRTRDLNLGKVALYQLSYFRKWRFVIASAKVGKKSESPNFTPKKS